jgi:hypothetical protein
VFKAFGIGLNKTGTRSLAEAMRILGFRTLHKGDHATSQLVERAASEGLPLLAYIGEQYDAYFDVDSIVRRYADLDQQYPRSRFILTTRALDGWLVSREKHVRANQERAARGEYDGAWLTIDRDDWADEWHRHHASVRAYFADRPDDLLVIDITSGEGWDKVAPFVGRPVPRRPFPWQNQDGLGTYRPEGFVYLARRYVTAGVRRLKRYAG